MIKLNKIIVGRLKADWSPKYLKGELVMIDTIKADFECSGGLAVRIINL